MRFSGVATRAVTTLTDISGVAVACAVEAETENFDISDNVVVARDTCWGRLLGQGVAPV